MNLYSYSALLGCSNDALYYFNQKTIHDIMIIFASYHQFTATTQQLCPNLKQVGLAI